MANTLDRVIVQEGWRNASVRLTGSLDTSDVTLAPVISLTDFQNNDKRLTLSGFRLDEVRFALQNTMGVTLYWESAVPQALVNLALEGEFCFSGGLIPDTTRLDYTGNICLSTTGFQVGKPNMFTIQLDLIKLYR